MFRAALGIGIAEADELRATLKNALQDLEAIATQQNSHGQNYQIDFKVANRDEAVTVRSAWIIRNEEDFPRLITGYVL